MNNLSPLTFANPNTMYYYVFLLILTSFILFLFYYLPFITFRKKILLRTAKTLMVNLHNTLKIQYVKNVRTITFFKEKRCILVFLLTK